MRSGTACSSRRICEALTTTGSATSTNRSRWSSRPERTAKGNDWVVRVSMLTFANEQRIAMARQRRCIRVRVTRRQHGEDQHRRQQRPHIRVRRAAARSRANGAAADRPRRPRPRCRAVRRRGSRLRSNLRGLCVQRADEVHGADHRCRRRCACRLAGNVKAEPVPDLIEMIEMIDDSADPFADRRAVAPSDAPSRQARVG